MTRRRSLSPKAREALYFSESIKAIAQGRGEQPICNICYLPIAIGQRWHESHNPHLPRALGGNPDGIAHARCNLTHAHKIDAPLIAKVKRIHQNHIGAKGPGLGNHPLPCGRNTSRSKSFRHGVVERLSLGEKIEVMKKRRAVK